MSWVAIATWPFSLQGIEIAEDMLHNGSNSVDVAESIIKPVEDDPLVTTVGYASFPNAIGELEFDAAIMSGKDLRLGCVGAIKNFKNPISVARAVMEKAQANILVGAGAERFADSLGLRRAMMLDGRWQEEWQRMYDANSLMTGHDTIGAVVVDGNGDITVATSTSGLRMKLPGRVGDSPIIGSGFYVDNNVGGATATGVGEDIMRGCMSYHAVMLMAAGMSPQKAAQGAVENTIRLLANVGKQVSNISIICANKAGDVGGYSSGDKFAYAYATPKVSAKLIDRGTWSL